jgi:cytochrome c-type biogenesis protein CcmF
MIAELGLAVLWMAAALAVLQLAAGIIALRPKGSIWPAWCVRWR